MPLKIEILKLDSCEIFKKEGILFRTVLFSLSGCPENNAFPSRNAVLLESKLFFSYVIQNTGMMPGLIRGYCQGCSQEQYATARRVMTIFSQRYPSEYSQIYYKYINQG